MMLSLEGVSKSFVQAQEHITIARDLAWQLPSGKSAAVVGPSGSGKTTIMNMIAGIEPLDGGHIRFGDVELSALNAEQMAEWRALHIGLVFQQFYLIPYLTAQENVALGLAVNQQHSWRQSLDEAMRWLERVGLAARAQHLPQQLSGGEKQRVAIARALIKKPVLLLADEPTGNLDAVTGEKIFQLLLDLQQQQSCTMLLITHDLNLAKKCHSTWGLQQGQLRPC